MQMPVSFPVFTGSDAGQPFEYLGKIKFILKAGAGGDLFQRTVRVGEQVFGIADPDAGQVFPHGKAGLFPEKPTEIFRGKAGVGG